MIKTIINDNPEVLDMMVNTFIEAHGGSLPVRTETFTVTRYDKGNNEIGSTVMHKATVFYDPERPAPKDTAATSSVPSSAPQRPRSHIGSLWKQEDRSVSGKVNDRRVMISPEDAAKLLADGKLSTELQYAGPVFITENRFKNKPTSPDYVVYPRDA